jgi:4-carboxymuconolactone decarboxylase
MANLPKPYQQFHKEHPDLYQAYENLGAVAANAGPLDAKTRELIKLGMAAANKSMSSVKSHTFRALELGVSPAEIEHALMLGITTLGFPTMMAALTWAKLAIAENKK